MLRDQITGLTTGLTRKLIHILRECKLEIKERVKMQRHYGLIGNFLYRLRAVGRDPANNANTWPKTQGKERNLDYEFSNDLNAQLKRTVNLYKVNKHIFDNPPRITFISYTIPRLDSTSSDFRLFHILKILVENNCKIDFLYCTRLWNDSKYRKVFEDNVNFKYLPLNLQDYVKFVTDKSPQYIWITELWRMNYVKFMAKLSEELKAYRPASKLIVDTIDFHFKEFKRKYELTKNPDDLKRANEFLENEKILYRAADTVVVISGEEKKDIQNKIPGIRKVETVPNIHEIHYPDRPYSMRKNICFVGHFGNKHNVNAVTYFIENVFQFILEKNPKVEFHVLGYSSEKYKSAFKSPSVKVIGGLKYLEKALTYYKLFVCPMTYGAGLKGKIGGAVAAGVPVVTTSIGAEGFPFQDGEECFIADSPKEFAEKCNLCIRDPAVWQNLNIKSRLMVAENFSPGVVAKKLKSILSK